MSRHTCLLTQARRGMWNYWPGGKDNFAADRELAGRVLEAMPSTPLIARARGHLWRIRAACLVR